MIIDMLLIAVVLTEKSRRQISGGTMVIGIVHLCCLWLSHFPGNYSKPSLFEQSVLSGSFVLFGHIPSALYKYINVLYFYRLFKAFDMELKCEGKRIDRIF